MTTTNTLYIAPASNPADRALATGDWTTNSFTDGDAAVSAAESMDATNPLAAGDEWVVCYRGGPGGSILTHGDAIEAFEAADTIVIDANDPFADLVALEDREGLVGQVREKGARVVAVEILSAAAAAGCGSWDDAALTALVRALEEHAEPEPTHCECGEWSGERCAWSGPETETVTVEWMPEQYRGSHTAARNAGVYPANGARHLQVHRKCAASMIEHDSAWCSIVGA